MIALGKFLDINLDNIQVVQIKIIKIKVYDKYI